MIAQISVIVDFVLPFLLGMLLGGFVGMFCTALVAASGKDVSPFEDKESENKK